MSLHYEVIFENLFGRGVKSKILRHLARQYRAGEMILNMEWYGSDKGVYFQVNANLLFYGFYGF